MIVLRSVTDSVCTRALPFWKIVPKCTKIDLKVPKIQNFPGGACPQTPLAAAPLARTAPGLLSPILDPPLSRTTRKLPPLPLLRDRVKDLNHRCLLATDSLVQDIIAPPPLFMISGSATAYSTTSRDWLIGTLVVFRRRNFKRNCKYTTQKRRNFNAMKQALLNMRLMLPAACVV